MFYFAVFNIICNGIMFKCLIVTFDIIKSGYPNIVYSTASILAQLQKACGSSFAYEHINIDVVANVLKYKPNRSNIVSSIEN